MSIRQSVKLLGRAWLLSTAATTSGDGSGSGGTGGGTGTATSFAVSLSASAGPTGTPVTVIITPVSGAWPSGVTLALSSTLAGTFDNPSLTPTGSVSVTAAFTPSGSASNGTISAAAAGMTSNGPQSYSVVASGGGSYAPLSGIGFSQPQAITPLMSGSHTGAGDNLKLVIAAFSPIGGVGPFTYTFGSTNPGGYRLMTSGGGALGGTSSNDRGWILIPWAASTTTSDLLDLKITDGTGAIATRQVTIDKTGTAPFLFVDARRSWPANQGSDPYFSTLALPIAVITSTGAGSGGNLSTADTISFSDPSGKFAFIPSAGGIKANHNAVLATGSYPFSISSSGAQGNLSNNIVLSITQAVMGPIQFTPGVVSTSVFNGWVVGTALSTTPNNSRTWSLLNSANGAFTIDTLLGTITTQATPSTPGARTIVIQCVDQNATISASFTINVQQGTTLPSTNISMTVAQNLTNYAAFPNTTQRAVGTPNVTGIAGTPMWFLDQERKCAGMDAVGSPGYQQLLQGGFGPRGWSRYRIDSSAGRVWAQAQLSSTAGTPGDQITVIASDGINTCSRSFYVPVAGVVGPVVHVGRGMSTSAPAGTTGYEHLSDALAPFWHWTGAVDLSAYVGMTIYVHWDSDPNYYANDLAGQNYYTARQGLCGPLSVIGVAGPQGQLPRVGGTFGMDGTPTFLDKAFFICNDGDFVFKNLDISFVHMNVFGNGFPPSGTQLAGIRFNSMTSGNLTVDNCDIHDCDVGIASGYSDGIMRITNTRLYNNAACYGGGSNEHNAYVGAWWKIVVDNLLTTNCVGGHLFKCRATQGTWTNCRFIDGERSSSFAQIDLCEGGSHTMDNCYFHKGAMPQTPHNIRFNEEWSRVQILRQDYESILTVTNSTFDCRSPQAVISAAIGTCGSQNPVTGVFSSITASGCTFVGWKSNQLGDPTILEPYSSPSQPFISPPGHDFSPVVVNPTMVTAFPTLNVATPCSYNTGRPGWQRASADFDHTPHYPYILGAQIDPGLDEIRVPAGSAPGTVLFTPSAYGAFNWQLSGATQPDPRINPFVAGSVWSMGQVLQDYTGTSFGLAQSHYSINASTGAVSVGSSGLGGAGLDLMAIRCTSPASTGSKVAEWIFSVVKT